MALPIIGDLISGVKDLLSEVIVDKDKKIQIEAELQKLEDNADQRLHDEMMAQVDVNKVEASQRSIFIAGWRPFIGWTGGVALAWTFVLSPFVEFAARLFGWAGAMPQVDTGALFQLILAMLGVGAMRSYDKAKGTSIDTLGPQPSVSAPKKFLGITLPEKAPWA